MLATRRNCSRRLRGTNVKMLYLLVRTWFETNVHPGAGTSLVPKPLLSLRITLPSSPLTVLFQPGMGTLGAVVNASGGTGVLTRTWRGYGLRCGREKTAVRSKSDARASQRVNLFCGPLRRIGVTPIPPLCCVCWLLADAEEVVVEWLAASDRGASWGAQRAVQEAVSLVAQYRSDRQQHRRVGERNRRDGKEEPLPALPRSCDVSNPRKFARPFVVCLPRHHCSVKNMPRLRSALENPAWHPLLRPLSGLPRFLLLLDHVCVLRRTRCAARVDKVRVVGVQSETAMPMTGTCEGSGERKIRSAHWTA